MGETEFKIFAVIVNLMLFVFIGGIIVFFLKYHKRKLTSEKEKAMLNEQHAQDLLHSKLEIQQQTMQDIGRDIHDNVGQLLTVASISAYQMAYDNICPSQNERVTSIGKIIDQSLSELRNLSRNLTNEKAEMAELIELLQDEASRINGLNICHVACSYNDLNFTVSNAIKNFMLRIIQEFIQNSLKHAACKNIAVDFNYDAPGLSIHLHDDGKGFDVHADNEAKERGIGLINMQKRADLIGAEFSFSSVLNEGPPGQAVQTGTSMDIFIPSTRLNFS
jgi:signal transduction histidine kinase